MTYTVLVLDRGRPIAKHASLDHESAEELAQTYRAIGWPESKVVLQAEEPELPAKAA